MKNKPTTPSEPIGGPAKLHARAHQTFLQITAPRSPRQRVSPELKAAALKKGILMVTDPRLVDRVPAS